MKYIAYLLLFAMCIYGITVTATWHFENYGVIVDVRYAADIESTISKTYILWPGEELALSFQPKSGKLTLDISVKQDLLLIGGLHFSREIDIKPGERREIEYSVLPGVKLKLYGKIDVQATVISKNAEPKTATCTIPCEKRFKIYNSAAFTTIFYATPTVGLDLSALGFSKKLLEKQLGSQEMRPPVIHKVSYILPQMLTAVAIIINLAAAIYALKTLLQKQKPPLS